MIVGERLKAIREQKGMSQGDVEKTSGLLRCYISRVENGHTVPAVETLERLSRALNVPMYQLFYDGDKPPEVTPIKETKQQALSRPVQRQLEQLGRLLSHIDDRDRTILVGLARQMAKEAEKKKTD